MIGFSVFDNPPIAVSAIRNQSGWSLRTVQFRDRGDLTSTIDKTRTLSNHEGVALAQAVRNSGFWLTTEPNEPFPRHTVDGEMWIIEGRRNGSYQAVRRWTATEQPIRTLALMLVNLAGLPRSFLPENPPSQLPCNYPRYPRPAADGRIRE